MAAAAAVVAAAQEVPSVTCAVKYHGFVYVHGSGGVVPGLDRVKEAFNLLRKPKKAQKAHPLFARGFSEQNLVLRCSEQGIKVIVKQDSGHAMQLMDHPIYRIAFVCNQGKSVVFISKRRMDSDTDQFKCHGFETKSTKTAIHLAKHLVTTCNSVFRKLRRTRKIVRTKTQTDGGQVPRVEPSGGPSTEEADRLQRELQAEVEAAKTYRMSLQAALEELDAEDEEEEDEVDMQIRYEDYAEEFAELALEAEQQAAGARQRTMMLLMTDEGDMQESTDYGDFSALQASEVDFDDEEYLITRSGTI